MDEAPAIRHPRATMSLVGQGTAERQLRAAWLSGRMAHGWLFAGPPGIGKATLAYRLARFMFTWPNDHSGLSESGKDAGLGVPGDAPAVHLVGKGVHPDLHVLSSQPDPDQQGDGKKPASARGESKSARGESKSARGESKSARGESKSARGESISARGESKNARGEIKIHQVRALSRVLTGTISAGGARVCIIDAADEMNRSAANALLKNLEEPPQNTFFILIAHHPARVLPTLRSRCRRLDLARLSRQDVAEVLSGVPGDHGTRDMEEIIALADGSAGYALRLAGEGGLGLAREILGLAQSLPGLDARGLHSIAARLAPAKADPQFRLFTELLLGWIADMVRVSATGQTSRFGATGAALATRLAPANRLEPWAALWENLTQALRQTLALNLDRKQFLLNAFFAIEATQRASSNS